MQSFRTEIENPIVAQDIIELEKMIFQYRNGKMNEEKFRGLRLARGVYGQRQLGVQMIRIKIPFGQLDSRKLLRICEVSDTYSKGRLHITTRQDIQIHYVSLDKTPQLWAELEKDEITLREACGNTVRNITASATSGIDSDEPFDPRPYADATFKYFLRNPICQEMGRKFKMSFSNSDSDTALAFMHDLGFIAKVRGEGKHLVHGFQVWMAGGLGSQSYHAYLYSDFVPADEIIPLSEAVLRVFERQGERSRRMKARLKFLVKDIGFDTFKTLVDEELDGMPRVFPIEFEKAEVSLPKDYSNLNDIEDSQDADAFWLWKKSNVIKQSDGLYAIGVKLRLGDLMTDQARKLVPLLKQYSGDEITLTIDQNFLIRHVEEKVLYTWFVHLGQLGLAEVGYLGAADITACPGTDTCNLGIASSTGLANILEHVIKDEYGDKLDESGILMKISGCMNSCGQHMIAPIGFQGMSMKAADKRVLPAAQILLGGAVLGEGQGVFADKVIKIPSKKTPEALRAILDDYLDHKVPNQLFFQYYKAKGKEYFYELLKPFGGTDNLVDDDFIDWGHSANYIKAIGVGECAGVVIDLVSTLFFDSEEKLQSAQRALDNDQYKDSVYHTYASIINTAKALLTADAKKTNSHITIASQFQEVFVDTGLIDMDDSFTDFAFGYRHETLDKTYADAFLQSASVFYHKANSFRTKQLQS